MMIDQSVQLRTNAQEEASARPIGEAEIDLVELSYRFLGHWKLIVASALTGAILLFCYAGFIMTPIYQATSKIYVMNSKDSAINLSDLQIGSYLTKDYKEVFQTWEVHEEVISNLSLDYSYTTLQSRLSITNPADTRILYITFESRSPAEAVDVANEYARVAIRYITRTMATEEPRIMSQALTPTRPVRPNRALYGVLGFIFGTLLAVAIVIIRFVMDDKIKTPDDIARYSDFVTLAVIPAKKESTGKAVKKAPAKREV